MKMRILRDREQSGVALVITLIMLAVVTFLAVAYLAMSRREQSSINAAEEQNRARLMAEAAFDHLKAKVIANILTYTNAGSDVVENNRHTNDFRFYLDFNRNGRFDMTRQTNDGGTGMVRTLQWGDPQWVGVLENPN